MIETFKRIKRNTPVNCETGFKLGSGTFCCTLSCDGYNAAVANNNIKIFKIIKGHLITQDYQKKGERLFGRALLGARTRLDFEEGREVEQ